MRRGNGLMASMGPEATLHSMVIRYIRLAYPSWVIVHPANEGRRTRWEQLMAKALGMQAGVSDLFIYAPGGRCLVLELKRAGGKLTPSQREFIDKMVKIGFSATWADNFDAAKNIIDTWGKHGSAPHN